MSIKEIQSKAVSVLCDVEQMHKHSSALVYADDSEKISFHIFWLKHNLRRFQESFSALERKYLEDIRGE